MKLAGVELVQVDLPFRQSIGTAAGVHRVRPLLFVRVVTEEAEGWGECAALEHGTAVDPTLAAVEKAALDLGVPRLNQATAARGGELPLAAGVAQLFGSTAVDRMLAATLEIAGAHAEARGAGGGPGGRWPTISAWRRASRRWRSARSWGFPTTTTSPCCAKRWTPPSV